MINTIEENLERAKKHADRAEEILEYEGPGHSSWPYVFWRKSIGHSNLALYYQNQVLIEQNKRISSYLETVKGNTSLLNSRSRRPR